MKNLEEIDCNEEIWSYICDNEVVQSAWGRLENECRFAFKTKDKSITEDDIENAIWGKYPNTDQIRVYKIKKSHLKEAEEFEKGYRYFAVSMIIYNSGICG